MNWELIRVRHSRFGEGEVISCGGGFIKVRFSGGTEKVFVYPDAFENFLSAEDEEAAETVRTDLRVKKETLEADRKEKEALQVVRYAVARQNAPVKKPVTRTRTAASRSHKMR